MSIKKSVVHGCSACCTVLCGLMLWDVTENSTGFTCICCVSLLFQDVLDVACHH